MTTEPTRRAIQEERRRVAKKSGRRWPRRLLIFAAVLVVLAGGLYGGAKWYENWRYDQIAKVNTPSVTPDPPAPGQPINVLLVGSDSRKFVKTTTERQEYGTTTDAGGQRSDVLMVARFVPATTSIYILSIPRDLWVDIPGTGPDSGHNRINTAFNTGPDLLIQTVQTDLHIPINHYLAVTFQGFQSMVTAVGGIDLSFPDPVKDAYSGLNVTTTGCQLVTGKSALALVRSRHLYYQTTGEWHYDGLSDFSRIQRQDAFFQALLAKVRTIKLDPIAINNFLGAATGALTIDTTFSEDDLKNLVTEFHSMPSANLHTETLPTVGYTTSTGADVLDAVEPDDTQMITAFLARGTTTTTTTTTTAVPPIPAATVTVEVLNGVTFAKPLASETSASLRAAGFNVSGIDNAATTVATTEIQYAPGHEAAALTVQGALVGTSQLVQDPTATGNDVVLTLGASFQSVVATASPTTGTTATPVATRTGTKIPVTKGDIYTNTQSEPWNPVPCTAPAS